MTFEIGDVVKVRGSYEFYEVVGVIQDSAQIFLDMPQGEVEFSFSDIDEQYRRIDNEKL